MVRIVTRTGSAHSWLVGKANMKELLKLLWSSVGRKILMAVTGLCLVGFVAVHLLGNLLLLVGGEAFNEYAHTLESTGVLLIFAELGLLSLFLLHALSGGLVTLDNRASRAEPYQKVGDAGGPSLKTFSSRTMIITGLTLLGFTIIHVWMFKYGPGVKEGYVTTLHDAPARDLYLLVVQSFKDPWIAFGYVGVMVLLGFHLRHAIWSAFQSLGIHHPRWTPVIYSLGGILAIALAVGFLFLPIWIFFTGGVA